MESKVYNRYLIRKYSLFAQDRECRKQLDNIIEVCGEKVLQNKKENAEEDYGIKNENEMKG
jgi:hypothetical protein